MLDKITLKKWISTEDSYISFNIIQARIQYFDENDEKLGAWGRKCVSRKIAFVLSRDAISPLHDAPSGSMTSVSKNYYIIFRFQYHCFIETNIKLLMIQ